MKLTNNTILITGGTSGIGYALARELKKRNNKVIVLGRDASKLKKLGMEGFNVIPCDLGNISDIEQAAMTIEKNHPDLNMLVNNAGVQYNYQISDNIIPLEKIRTEMNVNFSAQVVLTHLLLPVLANSVKAYIINTTSALGAFPKTDGLVYSASKAAMRNFTTGLRFALHNSSIKVIEFMPPVTDTHMTAGRNTRKVPVNEVIEAILPQIEKEKPLATVKSIRFFLWLSHRFPGLAHRILSNKQERTQNA